MSNDSEYERPRRKRKQVSQVVDLREGELHHPVHAPYVRDKAWKKDAVIEDTDAIDEND